MSFKENTPVELKVIAGPADKDGKPAQIKGIITKLTKAHALVRFTSISEGIKLTVKRSGELVIIGHLSPLDLPGSKTLSRTEAENILGEYVDALDWAIERGHVEPLPGNRFLPRQIETIKTACMNSAAEQRRSGDEAKKIQHARDYIQKVANA